MRSSAWLNTQHADSITTWMLVCTSVLDPAASGLLLPSQILSVALGGHRWHGHVQPTLDNAANGDICLYALCH